MHENVQTIQVIFTVKMDHGIISGHAPKMKFAKKIHAYPPQPPITALTAKHNVTEIYLKPVRMALGLKKKPAPTAAKTRLVNQKSSVMMKLNNVIMRKPKYKYVKVVSGLKNKNAQTVNAAMRGEILTALILVPMEIRDAPMIRRAGKNATQIINGAMQNLVRMINLSAKMVNVNNAPTAKHNAIEIYLKPVRMENGIMKHAMKMKFAKMVNVDQLQ